MGTSVINDISSILPSQPHEVYNSWRSAHSQGKAAVAAIRLQSWFFAPNRTQGPLGRHSASPRSLIHFLSMALPMMDTSHTWNPMTCVRVGLSDWAHARALPTWWCVRLCSSALRPSGLGQGRRRTSLSLYSLGHKSRGSGCWGWQTAGRLPGRLGTHFWACVAAHLAAREPP